MRDRVCGCEIRPEYLKRGLRLIEADLALAEKRGASAEWIDRLTGRIEQLRASIAQMAGER